MKGNLAKHVEKYEGAHRAEAACGMCCGFFVMLWIIPFLFAYVYHQYPVTVLICMGLNLLFSLSPLFGVHGHLLAATSFVCVGGAAINGLQLYYSHTMPLRLLQEGRNYRGVYAGQPAVAFSDAAMLDFAGDAEVDKANTFGMRTLDGGVHTFCVAPILDAENTGRVEFWAVGIDCCDRLDNFECDDAGDPTVHNGRVIPDPEYAGDDSIWQGVGKYLAPAIARRDIFLRAVELAEAAHGISSSDRPVFVSWTNESRDSLISKERTAVIVTIVIACFVDMLLAVLLTRMSWKWGTAQSMKRNMHERAAAAHKLPADFSPRIAAMISSHIDTTTGRGGRDICLLGCLFPFIVLTSCVMAFSWLSCSAAGEVILSIFCLLLAVVILALIMMPHRMLFGSFALILALLGSYIGHQNYLKNSFYTCEVSNHRTYSNVLPEATSDEYWDAGVISFDSVARVHTDKSIGFSFKSVDYCAAPIIGTNSSGVPRIDFWAVGKDCCNQRGGFTCDKVADNGTHTGVVVREKDVDNVDDEWREPFLKAVKAASDTYNIYTPERPILVRWSNDVKAIQRDWASHAVGTIIVTTISGFSWLSCLACTAACCMRQKSQNRQ